MRQNTLLREKDIIGKILVIRDEKVILDHDLAILYDVETKYLKRQVKRNIERFPGDFMFTLTAEEVNDLRCQIGTSSWGGNRYHPMAFTEQGIAQISSVLKSPRAINVNIQIIRLFTRMRKLLLNHKELLIKLKYLEQKIGQNDKDIDLLFEYLNKLISDTDGKHGIRPIGF